MGRFYYALAQRLSKNRQAPLSLWIVLSLPLILYLVGKTPGFFSGESLSGVDEPYRYYFRILFRAGTIAGNILFGLAFFVVARRVRSLKLRDYLTIAAIGDTIVGISLSTSALEQTYGVAAHSLVLLSSYLFSMGLYVVAISISQDSSLRKSIKRSMVDLIDNIGSAQMEQEVKGRVMKVIRNQQKEMEEQTGGFSYTVSENDVKEYMALIIDERRRSNILARDGSNKKTIQQNVPNAIASKISDSDISKRIEKEETNIIIKDLIEKLQAAGTKIEKTAIPVLQKQE